MLLNSYLFHLLDYAGSENPAIWLAAARLRLAADGASSPEVTIKSAWYEDAEPQKALPTTSQSLEA
jgi:hypothetical protein